MARFTFVDGDCWKAIYRDGVLISEGHSFHPRELFEKLEIDCEVVFPNQDWLDDRGNYPDNIRDLKYDA